MITRHVNRIGLAVIGVFFVAAAGFLLLHPFSSPAPAPTAQPSKAAASPGPTITAMALSVSPVPAKQDGPVRLKGRGFHAGEAVVIRVPADPKAGAARARAVTLATTHASPTGTVSAGPITLPDALTSGTYPLEAVGQTSKLRTTVTLYVRAKAPWINLSTHAVKPGASLGLIAGGFKPREQVTVGLAPAQVGPTGQGQDPTKLSKAATLATLSTDQVGNTAWSQNQIPLLRPGAYTLTARGKSSGSKPSATLVVEAFTPVVQLSPWSGPPGTKVELNVRGFAPGERVDVFLNQGHTAALEVTADQYGNVWGAGPIRVPYAAAGGTLPLRFVGEKSGAEVTATFQALAPKPWLELSAYSGPPGAPVGFSGGGWAADELVTVHLDSNSGPTVASGQADDGGWLRVGAAAAVPGDADGTVTFVAVGSHSRASASGSFKVVNPFDNLPQNLQIPNLPRQNSP